jgi:hypothetical protein
LGTQVGRALYENTWVDVALRNAKGALAGTYGYAPARGTYVLGFIEEQCWRERVRGVVIPDVRWPAGNEGKAILAAGGQLWRIDRPGLSGVGTSHASENQPAPDEVFARIIGNDGSLEELAASVRVALEGCEHSSTRRLQFELSEVTLLKGEDAAAAAAVKAFFEASIDQRSRSFEVAPEAEGKLAGWKAAHMAEKHAGQEEHGGAIGERWTHEFTPTSLGTVHCVRCSCGEKVDLTNYGEW